MRRGEWPDPRIGPFGSAKPEVPHFTYALTGLFGVVVIPTVLEPVLVSESDFSSGVNHGDTDGGRPHGDCHRRDSAIADLVRSREFVVFSLQCCPSLRQPGPSRCVWLHCTECFLGRGPPKTLAAEPRGDDIVLPMKHSLWTPLLRFSVVNAIAVMRQDDRPALARSEHSGLTPNGESCSDSGVNHGDTEIRRPSPLIRSPWSLVCSAQLSPPCANPVVKHSVWTPLLRSPWLTP